MWWFFAPIWRAKTALVRAKSLAELKERGILLRDFGVAVDDEILVSVSFRDGFLWAQKSANNFKFALRRQKIALNLAILVCVICCVQLSADASVFACAAALLSGIYMILCALNLRFIKQQIRALLYLLREND